MSNAIQYPKRLIEVDLPIRRISSHSGREKSIRHGHISTLHIWWARRPLAACRAVLCASLWPDPVDPNCPKEFTIAAKNEIKKWANENLSLLGQDSFTHFVAFQKNPQLLDDPRNIRNALLDFIADFSNWDNSNKHEFLDTCRSLTSIAHVSMGGVGTRPMTADSFAGGGSIPMEASRVGSDIFATDLNPIPVLLNKVVLEFVPKFGSRLSSDFLKWGRWIRVESEKILSKFYPKGQDGETAIAYLWARTVVSEAPSEDDIPTEIPLITTMWLSKNKNRRYALRWVRDNNGSVLSEIVDKIKIDGQTTKVRRPLLEIFQPKSESEVEQGSCKRSSATCPITGHTIPASRVRTQFSGRCGGTNDARMIAVVTRKSDNSSGRNYRIPTIIDLEGYRLSCQEIEKLRNSASDISKIPNEELPYLRSIFNIQLLGATEWGHLFLNRQLLALTTLVELIKKVKQNLNPTENEYNKALITCLSFIVDKVADKSSSLCRWKSTAEYMAGNTFGRQALPIVWDFCESNVFGQATGDIEAEVDWIYKVIEHCIDSKITGGQAELASAMNHPLPDDSIQVFFSDPPYYDSVPYADLSDFFYCWLKRSIGSEYPNLFKEHASPKLEEVVQLSERNTKYHYKTKSNFELKMKESLAEGRRITDPNGIGVIVFAHKTTSAWETMLQAVIDAGWIVVASWPIDTEMGSRLRAQGSAALASSVHLVCRPRENQDGSLKLDETGDWREILSELPHRIHAWMPRLADEGVVGADAIFACLGPALEVFSRYSRVEKASGEVVYLSEYLEHVWAAVAKEALSMVFREANAEGFEPDSRLTAMWLWTISGNTNNENSNNDNDDLDDQDEEHDESKKKTSGFALEYDAARKIAQGLGASLESLPSLIEIHGETARLLSVSDRANYLFGKDHIVQAAKQTKQKGKQKALPGFEEFMEENLGFGVAVGNRGKVGQTVLDRVHQAMLLFGAGRSEAMKGFLVDEGVGQDARFWRLAQALSALYPKETKEKRWVDGVLARKKGLGF